MKNEIWAENKYQEFQDADINLREAIIEQLKLEGFSDMAERLEQQQEEEDIMIEPKGRSIEDVMDDSE